MIVRAEIKPATASSVARSEGVFVRAIGLFDGTMIVGGAMIVSGIFIVAADISRQTGSAGGLLFAWIITGLLTVSAALSYGELAALFPHAGGQYIYLREAYSPLWGFLYGWTLFLVIQTGTIAAVAVGFARYLGVPISRRRAVHLSARSILAALGISLWVDALSSDSDRHDCRCRGRLRALSRRSDLTPEGSTFICAKHTRRSGDFSMGGRSF